MNAHAPTAVFDDSHHAATLLRKLCRALQLGPRYYLWDLPRYLSHRRGRGLPFWDGAAFTNPLREFRPRHTPPEALPPRYDEALALLAAAGVRLTIPRDRLEAMLRLWWSARDVAGDVIECGSYRGATALLIALLGRLNGVAQTVHLCDTFAGMPDTSGYDLGRRGGEFRPDTDQVEAIRRQAEAFGVSDRIEIHRGLFSQTFPALEARNLRFALVHIDANIYQGTLEACRFTLPRVAPNRQRCQEPILSIGPVTPKSALIPNDCATTTPR